MPCFCDLDADATSVVQKELKILAGDICTIIRFASHPTDRRPQLLIDTLKLIEHLYTGECEERK